MFAVENYFYPLKASRLNFLGFVSILGHYPSIDRPLAVFCNEFANTRTHFTLIGGRSGSVI